MNFISATKVWNETKKEGCETSYCVPKKNSKGYYDVYDIMDKNKTNKASKQTKSSNILTSAIKRTTQQKKYNALRTTKKINLLDLNTDTLNIIGKYVKQFDVNTFEEDDKFPETLIKPSNENAFYPLWEYLKMVGFNQYNKIKDKNITLKIVDLHYKNTIDETYKGYITLYNELSEYLKKKYNNGNRKKTTLQDLPETILKTYNIYKYYTNKNKWKVFYKNRLINYLNRITSQPPPKEKKPKNDKYYDLRDIFREYLEDDDYYSRIAENYHYYNEKFLKKNAKEYAIKVYNSELEELLEHFKDKYSVADIKKSFLKTNQVDYIIEMVKMSYEE